MSAVGALRGAIGFLTRLPLARGDDDWDAFRTTPVTFPLVGYLVGSLAALPFLLVEHLPGPTVALAYVLATYAITGIHHLDGVADLGDAMAVHGDADRRRAVLKDTVVGVGGVLLVVLVVVGVTLGALAGAGLPLRMIVGIVVAAEVGAKLGMATLACLARGAHEGMGAAFVEALGPRSLPVPLAASLPVALLTWPHPGALIALLAATSAAFVPWWWARRHLGGVNGDVFGATNELGRLVGLHAGVIAWTLWG